MKQNNKVADLVQEQPVKFNNQRNESIGSKSISLSNSTLNDKSTDSSEKKSTDDSKSKKEDVKPVSFIQLYRYAKSLDYALLVLGITCSISQGALNAIQSIIFKSLSNTLIEGQQNYSMGTFNYNVFYDGAMSAIYMFVGYGFGILILATVSMSCWSTLCERQVHQIRKRYFAAIMRQNIAWFDKHDFGELTTRMNDGMDRIKDGIGDKMGILFTYGTAFFSGLIVAFTISWRMTLVMMAFVPLLAGLGAFLTQFVSVSIRKEMRAYEKAGSIAEEVITGIRTVIALNGQKNEIARYEDRLKTASLFGVKKAFYIAFGTAWLFCFIFVAMSVAFWYGTTLYIDQLITPGAVFATFWAFIGGTMSLGLAAPQIGAILGAKNAAALIFDVIDREPEIDCESKKGKKVESPSGEIEFKSVCFHYETRPDEKVLKEISFKVPANKSVALVGASGCGKSTLIGLFLRYYNLDSGQITFDGVPVDQLNIRWLRRMVGFVSQEPVLFATTVEQNLRLGNENMSAEDMERVCRMANAHNFIKLLPEGYKTRIGEGGVQLSGGQKQRLAIARALARDPKVLLLDEATSALDTESERVVQHALDRASAGRTTLTIAHRLSTIRHADCIIVLDHGEIVESGTHEELMALSGTYKSLVLAQEIERSTKEIAGSTTLPEEDNEKVERSVRPKTPLSQQSRYSSMTSIESVGARTSRALSTASTSIQKDIEQLKAEAAATNSQQVSILEILKFARKEWLLIFFALLTSLLKGFTFPIFSLIYGAMFRALANPSNEAKLAGARDNAIYFSILGVGSGLAAFFGGLLFGMAGESLTTRLRIAIFTTLVKQDGEFFDKPENASGKLITRLATDAPNIRTAMDQRLSDVIQGVSSLILGIGIAFYYGPKMAPIGILTAMILMGLQGILAQYLKRRSEKEEKGKSEPMRLATEAIENYKTIQYLTRQQYFYDEFSLQMRKPHMQTIYRGIIQAFGFALHACYIFFNFAAAYRFGLWLIKSNNYTPYTVFQVIEAINLTSMSLLAVGTYFPEYVRGRLSATLIFRLLTTKPKIDSLSSGGQMLELDGNVKFKNVHFAYAINTRQPVLRGLNFEAFKGKTLALVGPSGSGKSTVIQMLERFYDPLDGQVLYDNQLCNQLNLHNLRSQVGLVSQEPILFNYSIRENIAYGLTDVTDEQVEEAAKQANAYQFIKEMSEGFDTNVGEKGSQLSGGQKQRIAIARAIIRNPAVLLMDEATSALDSESENVVQEALDRARSGRTCIVIAHRLSSIQNSDLILVIKDGAVIEQGTHQQLLRNNGFYLRLTEMQTLN